MKSVKSIGIRTAEARPRLQSEPHHEFVAREAVDNGLLSPELAAPCVGNYFVDRTGAPVDRFIREPAQTGFADLSEGALQRWPGEPSP